MTAEPLPRPADPGTVDAENPWPGLASFREADHDLFFGRELETEELLRLVLRERLTVLFGLSGLGKTSLLRAGLFPLLRQENVLPVYVRLDFSEQSEGTLAGQVRQAIVREAEAAGIEAPSFPASETLWESLHRQGAELWSPRNRIVTPLLVFDQFEEVFTLGRRNAARAAEAEAFLTELADLCEGSVPADVRERLEADPSATREFSFTRHPYKILLSLREDFLPELEGLRGRIRSIVQNRFRLRRMNGGNALRVVTRAGGHLVEPDVPERVLRFVAGREDEAGTPLAGLEIEPALLSVVCRELNNKRRAQGLPRITASLVSGNRDEILSDLYERSVNDLGPGVRSFIEERLLTKSGFRDTVALENAVELPGVTREALDRLTDRRLLRIEDRGGQQRLELTHDVLTGVIRKSRDLRREQEAGEKAEAERFEAERKLRRSRLVIALLALVLIGVMALAAWGLAAQRQAREALADSDLERARNLQDSTPAHALAYLARALRTEPESLPAQSLLTDLLLDRTWLRPIRELRNPRDEEMDLSPDRWYVDDEHGGVTIEEIATGQTFEIPLKYYSGWESSRDGQKLLVYNQHSLVVWDASTRKAVTLPAPEGFLYAALHPDGRRVLTTGFEAIIWDTLSGQTSRNPLPPGELNDPKWMRLSPDGERILIVPESMDEVHVWSLAHPLKPLATILTGVDFSEIELSRDGQLALARAPDRLILMNVYSGQTLAEVLCECVSARFVAGTQQIAAVDSDKVQRTWSFAAARTGTELPGRFAGFSRDGSRLAVILGEREIRVLDTDSGQPAGPPLTMPGRIDHVWLTPDGRFLAAAGYPEIRVWTVESGHLAWPPLKPALELRKRSSLQRGRVRRPRLGPGGRILATWHGVRVDLWQLETGQQTASLNLGSGPEHELMDFEFSPDGDRIATRSRAGAVRIWSSPEGEPIAGPLRHPKPVFAIDFSEDGRQLATASAGNAWIWDASSGELLVGPLPLPGINEVRFQSEDHLLAWSAQRVLVWETRTGRVAAKPISVKKEILSAQSSPDGDRLMIHQHDSPTLLLDVRTGRQLRHPIDWKSASEVRLSPNGKLLWASFDGKVHVLAIPTFPTGEGKLLARWAEAAGGYALDEESQLVALPDQIDRLESLRRETAGAPQGQLTTASLIRWFLADPEKRGISPVVNRTKEEYLRPFLESGQYSLWDQAATAFPGHPLFRKFPRPPTPPPPLRNQ